jgi:hypothetical protein
MFGIHRHYTCSGGTFPEKRLILQAFLCVFLALRRRPLSFYTTALRKQNHSADMAVAVMGYYWLVGTSAVMRAGGQYAPVVYCCDDRGMAARMGNFMLRGRFFGKPRAL